MRTVVEVKEVRALTTAGDLQVAQARFFKRGKSKREIAGLTWRGSEQKATLCVLRLFGSVIFYFLAILIFKLKSRACGASAHTPIHQCNL